MRQKLAQWTFYALFSFKKWPSPLVLSTMMALLAGRHLMELWSVWFTLPSLWGSTPLIDSHSSDWVLIGWPSPACGAKFSTLGIIKCVWETVLRVFISHDSSDTCCLNFILSDHCIALFELALASVLTIAIANPPLFCCASVDWISTDTTVWTAFCFGVSEKNVILSLESVLLNAIFFNY